MSEAGKVYQTKMEAKAYSGANGPAPEAALPKGTTLADFWAGGKLGGTACNDGNSWATMGK